MKAFALSALCCASLSAAQLVAYPNGAVAPYDPNVAIATANHFAAKAAHGVLHPAVYYGKRSADPQLVTYANGAVAPFDPNVAVATANHFAAKAAYGSWWPAAGAAGVHPAAAVVYGRKKRSADAQFLTYALPYAIAPYVPLVAHPNGAVVPAEPADVVEARADHLAAVAEASG